MEKTVYAVRVKRALKEAERRSDESIAALTALIGEVQHRSAAGLTTHAGSRAMRDLGLALNCQIDASTKITMAHDRLAADAEALGIASEAIGPFENKPDDRPKPQGVSDAA